MTEATAKTRRQELIVWLYSVKKTRPLQRYGYVYYISKRRNYAVMYVDADDLDTVIPKVEKLQFVKSVELSVRQEINMDFSVALEPERERIEKLDKADNLFEQKN